MDKGDMTNDTITTIIKKKISRSKIKTFDEYLTCNRDDVKGSEMFKELCEKLEPDRLKIKKIRCLAIGSFTQDFPARYQMALLLELKDFFNEGRKAEDKIQISIYDPVFTDDDKSYIKKMGQNWSIDEVVTRDEQDPAATLFFLPHAPLDLTEYILREETPIYWLANNIIQHTDRYTKQKLHDMYPTISKLLHYYDSNKDVTSEKHINDGFSKVTSKRRRRGKADKFKFEEPPIDYSSVETYFSECEIITDFNNGELLKNQPWINSFSDLTYHYIE